MTPIRLGATASLALALGAALASGAAAQGLPGDGVTVRPINSGVAEEIFQHEILYRGLEALGYEVAPPLETEYAALHLALAQGDADFTGVHWVKLHREFFENSGGDAVMVRLGTLIEDALQGYLVDEATAEAYGITNIAQLQDPAIAALFDADGDGTADLAGCNPGWGCELVIEHQLPEYGLTDTVTHNQGSYFALMADTLARFRAGQPILYYTWTPLWVSGVLVPGEEVRWLEVPYTSLPDAPDATAEDTSSDGRNLGFAVDEIVVLANRDFAEENPAAARFLELAKISINDISAENLLMNEGEDSPEDISRHVDAWIADHQAEFDGWIAEGLAAAG